VIYLVLVLLGSYGSSSKQQPVTKTIFSLQIRVLSELAARNSRSDGCGEFGARVWQATTVAKSDAMHPKQTFFDVMMVYVFRDRKSAKIVRKGAPKGMRNLRIQSR
jgi:hypothetical protein